MTTMPLLRIQRLACRIHELRLFRDWMKKSFCPPPCFINSSRGYCMKGDDSLSSYCSRNMKNKEYGSSPVSDGEKDIISDISINKEKLLLNAYRVECLRENVDDKEDGNASHKPSYTAAYEHTTPPENESKNQPNNELNLSETKNSLISDGDQSEVVIKKFEPTFNLAPLIFESKTLQTLVKLGVDLSQLEKYEGVCELIIKLDFEKDISPYLMFLKDLGVEDLGKYLTRNPLIFQQSMDDLNIRIRYLVSKKFSVESVKRIVSKAPLFLSLSVTTVDRKLGFLQNSFHLTGNEVRDVATMLPKIITWKLEKVKENRNYIHQFLGFTNIELKKMLLIYPKVYLMDKYAVGKKFDFLHNTMGLDHKRLLEWPSVFGTRLPTLKNRHLFLLKVDRAQYDPTKENFVSLKKLCSGRDGEFCVNVAKTSVKEFNDFMKCL